MGERQTMIPRRLRREETGLLLVDYQERLLPAIHDHQGILASAVRLAAAAGILRVPILLTEQNSPCLSV